MAVEQRDPQQRADRVLPSRSDPAGRAASTAIGGPWGRHGLVGRQWFWTPLRVILALTILTLIFSWVFKSPCQDGNWSLKQPVSKDKGTTYVLGKEYVRMCYSDVIPLYSTEHLNTLAVPYKDAPVEYPVLTGYFMYAAAEIAHGYDRVAGATPGMPRPPPVQTYYEVTALMLAICTLVMVWAVARLARRRVWDAVLVALSPVLFVHAFTNWDLFAVALATAGMLAWARRRHALAGVLFGLGTAAKLYPLFLLGPLLVLCIRARRLREFAVTLAWTVGSWLVVNLPIALLYPTAWKRFFSLNSTRPADPDTLWNVGQYLANHAVIGRSTLNAASFIAFALVCVGVGLLALTAQRRPRVAQLAFLLVAGFLITNKVWSPQYSLWLVPLAVLARPSWRAYLIWQIVDAFLWFPRMYWYLQTQQQSYKDQGYQVLVRGLSEQWFLLAVVARDVTVVAYAVLVIRDIVAPRRDVVRADGDDDPAGGVLDGAPDAPLRRTTVPAASSVF